jgi:hypothetical protein
MEIHPAVAFGSVIVGAGLIGPVGAFLALPAAAIVQAFATSYIHRFELVEVDDLEFVEVAEADEAAGLEDAAEHEGEDANGGPGPGGSEPGE